MASSNYLNLTRYQTEEKSNNNYGNLVRLAPPASDPELTKRFEEAKQNSSKSFFQRRSSDEKIVKSFGENGTFVHVKTAVLKAPGSVGVFGKSASSTFNNTDVSDPSPTFTKGFGAI